MRLDDLPIFPMLPAIEGALRAGSLALSAETGAGKTSAVPAWLASRGALQGKAIVLEPRRIAAVSAAARVSELLGTELGTTAGYRVRGDSRASGDTVVEFVTEAVFIRIVQEDPLLSGVSLVVFDEFHERSAASDLGLAFASEAREARGDLSLLAMSATMDAAAVAAYLSCPVIESPGRLYPIETRYSPPKKGERPEDAVAGAVLEALDTAGGDVLAFLPGLREIATVASLLRDRFDRGAVPAKRAPDVLSLHGSLSLAEQRSITSPRPDGRRRVILATSVAETSLTVPGVGAVVDSGLSRFIRFHAPSGLNRLVTERASVAEAGQRRGRAGRTGPGVCFRCWDESDILPPSRGPELDRIELSSVVLECAVRGARSPEGVRWLDPPPRRAWDAASAVLRGIGLVDDSGQATDRGKRAVAIGADPRAAAALLAAGTDAVALHTAALAAAALSERDGQDSDGDFRSGLERALSSAGTNRIRDEAGRLVARVVSGVHRGARVGGRRAAFDASAAKAGMESVGDLLAPGFPDRLARRLPDDTWEFPSGRRARSAFAPPRVDWLLAIDADAGDPLGYIRRAAPVGAKAAKAALLPGSATELEVEWRGLAAAAWERTKAGAFTLGERRLEAVPEDMLAAAFSDRLRAEGLGWLPWGEDSRSLIDRARFVAVRGAVQGDWGDAAVMDRVAEAARYLLRPKGPVLDEAGLYGLLREAIGGETLSRIDELAPAFVTTPGGRRRRPTYPASGPARLAGRIQEFFGMAQGPSACGEAMTLELASPADRPLQVTSDLASFWRSAYPSIRPEMARRYPRHYWPEDPLVAEATKGQKPRRPSV
jgi:ATP-dependent helicase HrpB